MLSGVWAGDHPITQEWGCTDLVVEPYWFQTRCHWHCGVDIGMNTNTLLYAARAGVVRTVSYGLLGVSVGAQVDWYIHIDRSAVAVGASVSQGQLVAYSGAKVPAGGYVTGPHLHFEVQSGALNIPSTSRDPIPVLAATFGGGASQLGEDMTDDQSQKLDFIYNLLIAGALQNPPHDLLAQMQAGFGKVLAVPAGAGGLTAAQAAQLTAMAGDLETIRQRIEKDLAP